MPPMTEKMFKTLLAKAEATSSKRGPASLPTGKTLSLYVAANGASMSVNKVTHIRLEGDVVEATNNKGELFLFALENLYAASISGAAGPSAAARKAGFLG